MIWVEQSLETQKKVSSEFCSLKHGATDFTPKYAFNNNL